MHAPRFMGPFLVVLALTSGCASRTRVGKPVTEAPEDRHRRVMDEASRAVREGRPAEGLGKYVEVATTSAVADVSRQAYLQAALLRLAGDVTIADIGEAARLLRECRTRFGAADEPLALTATLTVLAQLEIAEQAVEAAAATAAREAAQRDEDVRALRRSVASLRQQLEKRDEALRKAAEAVVGPARPR
jgi:hypothetical protein